MSASREKMLARIKDCLGPWAGGRAEPGVLGAAPTVRVARADSAPGRLDRFEEELEALEAGVHHATDIEAARGIVASIVSEVEAKSLAHSADPLSVSVLGKVEDSVERHTSSTPRSCLLEVDLGITCAQWGIAETGSLVLESDAEDHRLVSLIPPHHVALIAKSNILASLDEALAKVARNDAMQQSRAITLITGPSRTADIELLLVIGVHGPKKLDVIILEDDTP